MYWFIARSSSLAGVHPGRKTANPEARASGTLTHLFRSEARYRALPIVDAEAPRRISDPRSVFPATFCTDKYVI